MGANFAIGKVGRLETKRDQALSHCRVLTVFHTKGKTIMAIMFGVCMET